MKRSLTLLAAVLLTASMFGQSPEQMSYQAIVRDNSNHLVINAPIGMQISILQGSETGSAVYVETQTPTTNDNGLTSIKIGSGNVMSGSFSAINWASGPYFIKIETDPAGGTNYSITSVSQLLSVPYALHAKTAESIVGDITETDPLYGASAASNISASDITTWNNKLSSYTETDPTWTSASANYYTKTNMQTSGSAQLHFNNVTNKPTTLSGYGITDAMSTTHAANAITTENITTWNSNTLPSQTDNAGKYLTTNGSTASWADNTTIQPFGYYFQLATIVDATVVGGADIPLSNNGPNSDGFWHMSGMTFITVPSSGVYKIDYSVSYTSGVGAAIAIAINGTVDSSTTKTFLTATGYLSGSAMVELAAGDVITLRNNSATPFTLDLAPSVSTQLTITYLGARPPV